MLINQGIKHLYEMKLAHFLSNELLRRMKDQLSISNIQQIRAGRVEDAILCATKEGIFEIVFEMVKANPQLVWSHDARSKLETFFRLLSNIVEPKSLALFMVESSKLCETQELFRPPN